MLDDFFHRLTFSAKERMEDKIPIIDDIDFSSVNLVSQLLSIVTLVHMSKSLIIEIFRSYNWEDVLQNEDISSGIDQNSGKISLFLELIRDSYLLENTMQLGTRTYRKVEDLFGVHKKNNINKINAALRYHLIKNLQNEIGYKLDLDTADLFYLTYKIIPNKLILTSALPDIPIEVTPRAKLTPREYYNVCQQRLINPNIITPVYIYERQTWNLHDEVVSAVEEENEQKPKLFLENYPSMLPFEAYVYILNQYLYKEIMKAVNQVMKVLGRFELNEQVSGSVSRFFITRGYFPDIPQFEVILHRAKTMNIPMLVSNDSSAPYFEGRLWSIFDVIDAINTQEDYKRLGFRRFNDDNIETRRLVLIIEAENYRPYGIRVKSQLGSLPILPGEQIDYQYLLNKSTEDLIREHHYYFLSDFELLAHVIKGIIVFSNRYELMRYVNQEQRYNSFFIPLNRPGCMNSETYIGYDDVTDTNIPLVAFGDPFGQYHCYDLADLLSSFIPDLPDFEAYNFPLGFHLPSGGEVSEDNIKNLVTLLKQYPSQIGNEVLTRIEQVKQSITPVSEYFYNLKRDLGLLDNQQKGFVREVLLRLLYAGMYFRRWKGPGHPFPYGEDSNNLRCQDPIGALELNRIVEIVDLRDSNVAPETADILNRIRRLSHIENKLSIVDNNGYFTSRIFRDMVDGFACVRMASRELIIIANEHLRKLFNINIPGINYELLGHFNILDPNTEQGINVISTSEGAERSFRIRANQLGVNVQELRQPQQRLIPLIGE